MFVFGINYFIDIWGGWVCFVVFIVMIGVLIMVIGDVVLYFGCIIGLVDSVVVIIFVVFGISFLGKNKKILVVVFILNLIYNIFVICGDLVINNLVFVKIFCKGYCVVLWNNESFFLGVKVCVMKS